MTTKREIDVPYGRFAVLTLPDGRKVEIQPFRIHANKVSLVMDPPPDVEVRRVDGATGKPVDRKPARRAG
jgi:hypothetical protein